MKVIIVVASKHGSTRAIAELVGEELRARGTEVRMTDAHSDVAVDGYDAAVIGSAVYVGHWMKDARRFLEVNREPLRRMPVWLFSSGPLGDPPRPKDELAEVQTLVDDLQARNHRVFAGSLAKPDLSLAERAAVRVIRAPYGDAREWDEIRSWATAIAADLVAASWSTAAGVTTP